MNPQTRAVRAAERQLRALPPALSGILRAESIAGRLQPALAWAEAAPFDALGGLTGGANGRETGQVDARRRSAPLPDSASTRSARSTDAQGALAGARSAAEALGAAVARGARALDPPGAAGRSALADALSGSGQGAAASGEGTRPVFSLGALARRGAATLPPDGGARRNRLPPEPGSGGALAAALGGGAAGSGAALALAEGVVAAGLQAAARAGAAADAAVPGVGAAAGAAEALAPAIEAIRRRLGVAASRAAETRAAAQAAGERAAVGTGDSGQLAALAAAATRAISDPSPSELASNLPPTLPGQIEAAPVPSAGGDSTGATQAIAADWVVSVVGDALLEQARRQGIDLT